jgi:hypothetical protein
MSMREAELRALEGVRRYGNLSTAAGMLSVRSHCWFNGAERRGTVIYIGSTAAMLAAGCLTPAMLAIREAWRKGRPLCDDHGEKFRLHRPSKCPGRITLILRRLDIALPRVRDLFPDGLPEPEPVEAQHERAKQRTRAHLTVINGGKSEAMGNVLYHPASGPSAAAVEPAVWPSPGIPHTRLNGLTTMERWYAERALKEAMSVIEAERKKARQP